jgi:hypothetical protein
MSTTVHDFTIVRVQMSDDEVSRVDALRGDTPISSFLRDLALRFADAARDLPTRPAMARETKREISIAFKADALRAIEQRRGGIPRAVFVREAALAQISGCTA